MSATNLWVNLAMRQCNNWDHFYSNCVGGNAGEAFKDLQKLSHIFKDQLAYPLIAAAREGTYLFVTNITWWKSELYHTVFVLTTHHSGKATFNFSCCSLLSQLWGCLHFLVLRLYLQSCCFGSFGCWMYIHFLPCPQFADTCILLPMILLSGDIFYIVTSEV